MTDTHIEFVGSIPEIYDRHLGPLLFEHYAADLAGRVTVPPGGRVLELACGTGIATERLRAALPEDVEIVATDLNEAMLDLARSKRGNLANVHYQVADALDLPFEDGSFDAVVCQFGVMFFPDKAAGAREAARVLKPGGTYVFNVWDSLDRNPVIKVAQDTISGFFDGDPPTFLSIPFGYHALDPITVLLQDAGFGAPTSAWFRRSSSGPRRATSPWVASKATRAFTRFTPAPRPRRRRSWTRRRPRCARISAMRPCARRSMPSW